MYVNHFLYTHYYITLSVEDTQYCIIYKRNVCLVMMHSDHTYTTWVLTKEEEGEKLQRETIWKLHASVEQY